MDKFLKIWLFIMLLEEEIEEEEEERETLPESPSSMIENLCLLIVSFHSSLTISLMLS